MPHTSTGMRDNLPQRPELAEARDAATADGSAVDRLDRVMSLIESVARDYAGPAPEGTHRDDMTPGDALAECYDLWASGAWPDSNAEAHLDEVVDILDRALD